MRWVMAKSRQMLMYQKLILNEWLNVWQMKFPFVHHPHIEIRKFKLFILLLFFKFKFSLNRCASDVFKNQIATHAFNCINFTKYLIQFSMLQHMTHFNGSYCIFDLIRVYNLLFLTLNTHIHLFERYNKILIIFE